LGRYQIISRKAVSFLSYYEEAKGTPRLFCFFRNLPLPQLQEEIPIARGDPMAQQHASTHPVIVLIRHLSAKRGTATLLRLDYDGFGKPTARDSPAEGDRYRFTAREFDAEEAMQYNRARCYDPSPGRWLSEDPLGFDAGEEGCYRYPSTGSAPPPSDGHPRH
jgi:RHS repeat-associated protein